MYLPPVQEVKKPGKRNVKKQLFFALPLLCLLIFGTLLGARLLRSSTSASAASYATIKGQVPKVISQSKMVSATDASQSISISVGLQLRNASALQSYVDSMTRHTSINAHHHLSSAQVATAYAPLTSSQQAVIAYLQGYGFQVTTTDALHLTIGFQGTVGAAENAFHIQINNYVSTTGLKFYSPTSNPTLPANLASLIQNIAGLDNSVRLTHSPITLSKNVKASLKANLSCAVAGNGYWLPSQIASIYNLSSFYSNGYNGEGQTIALQEFDGYQASDITNYTSCLGGGSIPISKISVDGGVSIGFDAAEVELDMELIMSAAPKLGNLQVYEAPNTATGLQDDWSSIIANDSASVISTSWGRCEARVSDADRSSENNLFLIAQAQGQTIFASSGDSGTNDCGNNTYSVEDPASQPYVTGVGGTTLSSNDGISYGSETVWNNNLNAGNGAGGGGISNSWTMPSWQSGPGVTNTYSTGNREVPDVSLDADPYTGYPIYCSVSPSCTGHTWILVGGTSAAAPMWAAFMALANEKTVHDGGFDIGFVNPYLYQIDQSAGGTSYANDFHDITVGNNDKVGTDRYPATANYDMATGLGSYNAWNLAQDLEKLATVANGTRSAPANKMWYFAEGSVGGNFTQYLTLLNPSTTQTAHVTVQYLFESQSVVTKNYVVAPSTRFTATVNNDLNIPPSAPQQAISTIVSSDIGVVAERPLYFNRSADLSSSGTDVLGATNATSTTFYFAAGDTSMTSTDAAREFVTILNPNQAPATLTATFYSGGSVVDTEHLVVNALHRGTIQTTYAGKAAIKVTSDLGVVVERPIYYHKIIVPTAGGTVTGAASTVAATNPGTDWLFAEGHTGDNFQENLVLANFGSSSTTATINLEYTNGSVQSVPVTVAAQSQFIFDVNNAYMHPIGGTPTTDVSIEVTSTDPVVAERVMYFHYQGSISGVTDVVGEPGPSAHSVYSFAEGYTNNGFQEYLTLQNPNANTETVAVTLFFDGTIAEREVVLHAHSRATIDVNSIVVPIARAYANPGGGDGYNVSIDVQAFGGTVVVERPLYFNFMNQSPGGSDVIGYTGG